MIRSRLPAIACLLLLLVTTAVTVFIGRQVYHYRTFPFDSDEANHANGALAIWLPLHNGDLPAAAQEFYRQGFYPPGFNWLKALAFLAFGPSPLVARLFTVACLFVAVLLIYAVCLEVDRDYGWLAGLIAATLTLTMQPLLVNAALVMMEAPGLLAAFTLLWAYLGALKRPTPGRLLIASLSLLLTFLTKYTYGLVAVTAVAAMELSLLIWPPDPAVPGSPLKRLPTGRWACLFGPFALAMLLWFVSSENQAAFWAYATSQPPGQPWLTSESLLFYPRIIALQQLPSPLFVPVTASALLWAFGQWRDPRLRLFLLYLGIGLAMMILNMPKESRFIATFVPAAHLLTGLMIARLAAKPADAFRRAAAALLLMTALVSLPVVAGRLRAYPSLMEAQYETDPQAAEIATWVIGQLPAGERFFLVNSWDQLSWQALAWQVGTTRAYANLRLADATMPAVLLPPATPASIAAFRQEFLQSDARYLVLFEGSPWGAPFWPEYTAGLQDVVTPVARSGFTVQGYDTQAWLDSSLLQPATWEVVKANSHYTLEIQVILFQRTAAE